MNWWNTINGFDLLMLVAGLLIGYVAGRRRGNQLLQIRCEVVKAALTQAVRERDAALDRVKVLLACIRVDGGGLSALKRMLQKSDDANERLDSLEARLRKGVI